MYVTKCNEITVVEFDDTLLCKAGAFFEENADAILYVVKEGGLLGIVTRIDYNKNKENGNILNTNFKKIQCTNEQSEDEIFIEAYGFFEKYKNVSELPVIDEGGKLLFSVVRKGSVYDVFPGRFKELYGFNAGFAEFIKGYKEQKLKISADAPELMDEYLASYMDRTAYEVRRDEDDVSRKAEELFKEYELSLFWDRVQKYQMKVHFFELPVVEDLVRISEGEKERVRNAKKCTTQYYLQNYNTNGDIQELVDKVLGNGNLSAEFVDALRAVAKVVFRKGLCQNADYESTYVNVINGRRMTTDVPQQPQGRVYMFGPCTVFGVITEDKGTIASYLQRILVEKEIRREVVNEGMDAAPILEAIRKFNRTTYCKEDTFLFFINKQKETEMVRRYSPETSILSLAECYNEFEFHDYFLDSPVHPNQTANEAIAKYLFEHITFERQNQKGKIQEIPVMIEANNDMSEELQEYLSELKEKYREGKNGAIVMNCNPFTNGHLYLIEYAAAQVDNLYVFVVSEDKSCFPFSDRLQLVREGIKKRVENVVVMPSGSFVLSAATFPEYFTKEDASEDVVIDTSFDLEIFAKYIAPVLNISVRFAGEEPYDVVTRQYNRDMEQVLPKYGIRFECVPRKCISENECISASKVRKYWKEGSKEEVRRRVPQSTYEYLFPEG